VCRNFGGDLLACQALPYSREHFRFSFRCSPLSAFMSVLMLYCKLNCRFPEGLTAPTLSFSLPAKKGNRLRRHLKLIKKTAKSANAVVAQLHFMYLLFFCLFLFIWRVVFGVIFVVIGSFWTPHCKRRTNKPTSQPANKWEKQKPK